jgi:hypothetical protein
MYTLALDGWYNKDLRMKKREQLMDEILNLARIIDGLNALEIIQKLRESCDKLEKTYQ